MNDTMPIELFPGLFEDEGTEESDYNVIDTYVPVSYNELMANPPPPPDWLVDSLFPLGGIGIIGGDGGIGKSWLTLYLALCVASGRALFDHFPVKQGKVLLIDEEDALNLIHKRLCKLSKGMGINNLKDIPLLILADKNVMLDRTESYRKLSKLIVDEKPVLVTIDSLVRVHNADENSATEMNRILRRAKALIADSDCSIILTHHTNKTWNSSARAKLRGSTDIRNFVDSYIFMKGNIEEKTLQHDKSRWDIPVPEFKIKLKDIDADSATVLYYVGDTPMIVKRPRAYEAKELIMKLLEDKDKKTRKYILREARKVQIGTNTIDNTLKELEKAGVIGSKGGNGRTKKYWLKKK